MGLIISEAISVFSSGKSVGNQDMGPLLNNQPRPVYIPRIILWVFRVFFHPRYLPGGDSMHSSWQGDLVGWRLHELHVDGRLAHPRAKIMGWLLCPWWLPGDPISLERDNIVTVQARRSFCGRICGHVLYLAVALVGINSFHFTELSLSARAGGWADRDPTLLACDNINRYLMDALAST